MTKIVWPFEPSDSNKTLDGNIKKFLTSLNELMKIEVQPVCVMGSRYAEMGQYFESYDNTPLRDHLVEDCKKYLEDFKELPLKEFVLIDNFHTAQSAETMLFNDYIEKEKPDFVVVASHGRKGWERTFLGSFTENLLTSAQCPIFVMGPNCQADFNLEKALMPVEINEASGQFIEHFMDNHHLGFVKNLELFHKISLVDYEDIAWAPTFYGVADYTNRDILSQAKKAADDFLSPFLEHPLSQKRVSVTISESIDSVCDCITDQIKKSEQGLLIMRSQAGFWSVQLLGSITKTLIRESSVPVLVYPHKYSVK